MTRIFQHEDEESIIKTSAADIGFDHEKQAIEKHIAAIEQYAESAGADGFYGLQDACLIIVEALRELSDLPQSDDSFFSKADLLSMLDEFPILVEAYRQDPGSVARELVITLHHPDLDLALSDDDFAVLATELNEGKVATDSPGHHADRSSLPFSQMARNFLHKRFIRPVQKAVHQVGMSVQHQDNEPSAPTSEDSKPQADSLQFGSSLFNPEKQTVEDYIAAIEQFADQAVLDGYYGLQDACLVIADALRELPEASAPLRFDLLSILNQWPQLMVAYRQEPQAAIAEIIKILRHPDLNLPLMEDEFVMIETMLVQDSSGAAEPQAAAIDQILTDESLAQNDMAKESVNLSSTSQGESGLQGQTVGDSISVIEAFADRAAENHYYGLQDACLLMAEALRELPQEVSASANPDLLALLDDWSALINAYHATPGATAASIIKILRHPDLHLPLSEDEFAMLETALAEPADAGDGDARQEPVEKPAPLSPAVLELIQLLVMQAELIDSGLQSVVLDNTAALPDDLQQLAEYLERYTKASEMAGFEGLARICEHVHGNILRLSEDVKAFTPERLALLRAWIDHVKDYLAAFNATDAGQVMLAQLGDSRWILPLSADAGAAILTQIQATDSTVSSQEEEIREKVASPEDVSLALPDDVNRELLELLLQELPIYTQQFSEAVQRIQAGGSVQDIEVAQRIAHTLKGSANTVGVKGIAVLTHQLEDILTACAKAHRLPGDALANVLIEAADCLESMSECLMGLGDPPDEALTILQGVLDWANRIEQNGIQEIDDKEAQTSKRNPIDRDEQETLSQTEPAEPASQKSQAGMVRVPTEQIDNLFRLTGESIILNSQANERLRRMKHQLQTMETQFSLLQQLGDGLQELIDLKDLSGRSLVNLGAGFDALEMDQYNELHTASLRLVEAAVDAREMSLDARKELDQMGEVLEYQQRMIIDTQEAIMTTRLVPVSTITPRLQRGMRQTCRLTGKQSDLILSGETLLIDSDTLNSMVDPLMHLLRNAVDHGIESESERVAKGKPRHGRVSINFEREGNNILVSCRDDGRGLDFAAIREAAEKQGVLKPDQAVSEDDLKRFILRPNFSTRSHSTQTSGRGVGMDAVYFQVTTLGGSLSLHSEQGQGLTVELTMPLPLSRSHALLAQAGNYRVAIAGKGIIQVIYSGSGEFITVDGERMLRIEDNNYPLMSLNRLLRVPQPPRESRAHSAVLLVQSNEKITAVLLDAITDSLDIVIKNFGFYIKKIPGFMGAAIMGDGSVAPVLDVPELLRIADAALNAGYIRAIETIEQGAMLPKVLVVDDSLSQRRALEQLLHDTGFHVISARDGIEAVEMLEKTKPDIVLTDLEMPRMNGIELASHIRSKEGTKTIPVIMITSRTTQKHRKMAEDAGVGFYIVKPVREDDLLTKMQILLEKAR